MRKIKNTKVFMLVLIVVFANLFELSGNAIFANSNLKNVKNNIVKITVYNNGQIVSTGGGIILNVEESIKDYSVTKNGKSTKVSIRIQKIYIMTPYHVIFDKRIGNYNQVEVTFFDKTKLKFTQKDFEKIFFEKVDKTNELAVIIVETRDLPNIKLGIEIPKEFNMKSPNDIRTVSHPFGNEWLELQGQFINNEYPNLKFSGDALDPASSGGALLNKNYQLIGMILREESDQGIALRIDIAKQILDKWEIPTTNLMYPKSWWKKNKKIILCSGGGIIVSGLIYCLLNCGGDPLLPDPPPAPPF